MTINYHTLNVSPEAKETARAVMQQMNVTNLNGELAFWLNIPVPSDSVALAIYIQDLVDTKDIDTHEIDTVDELIADIQQHLPTGLLKPLVDTNDDTSHTETNE